VLGFALVLGGGLSNLLDRILKDGRVIDFMMLKFGGMQTAIFNFADVMIIMGISVLLFELWRTRWTNRAAWQQ
jgi:signal peptidase II